MEATATRRTSKPRRAARRYVPKAAAVAERPGPRLLASFREGELMQRGLLPCRSFTSAADLVASCLA